MKFKHGDKVKIIQRKPENTTGSVDYNKPNGDVGKVCYLRTYNNKFQLTGNKNGTGYYYGMYDNSNDACFQDDDLELVSDEFVLPEKWCIKQSAGEESCEWFNNKHSVASYVGGAFKYLVNRTYDSPLSSTIPDGYTEITFDQFKKYVLKDTVETIEKPKFEVGKWYKYSNCYIKFEKLIENDLFRASDDIIRGIYDGKGGNYGRVTGVEHQYILLTDLSEIQQYLPDGHVDKVKVIPEYVRCTLPFSDQTKGNIYKVSPDGYVEDNKGSKSILTWNGGGFEKSTKEAYDAQFKPMEKNEFKKGDYIVTLKVIDNSMHFNCGRNNYCFKQRVDNNGIFPEIDLQGSDQNGHCMMSFDKNDYLKDWRYATPEEIAEYDRLGKPYDVTTLLKKEEPNKSLVGRYLKVIEDYANGTHYEEGDYIQIVSDDLQGRVKCNNNYSFGQNAYDWNKSEVELMPEGFVPPIEPKAVSEEKPEEWEPKVGDWVMISEEELPITSTWLGEGGRIKHQGPFLVEKIEHDCVKKMSGIKVVLSFGRFRKAEPHEIPKTEEPGILYNQAAIQAVLPNKHLHMAKPHKYTAEEALAELKRRGFKKGVEYVFMYEDGTYSESNTCTANWEPKIQCYGDYIDCGRGYLWSKENPTHLHEGPISEFTTNLCGEIVIPNIPKYDWVAPPTFQSGTSYQAKHNNTPNYSKPETLLTKTTLNY